MLFYTKLLLIFLILLGGCSRPSIFIDIAKESLENTSTNKELWIKQTTFYLKEFSQTKNNPKKQNAAFALGFLYMNASEIEKAKSFFRFTLSDPFPLSMYSQFYLAQIASQEKEYHYALSLYQALLLNKQSILYERIIKEIIHIYNQLNNYPELLNAYLDYFEYLQNKNKSDPIPTLLINIAKVYSFLGQVENVSKLKRYVNYYYPKIAERFNIELNLILDHTKSQSEQTWDLANEYFNNRNYEKAIVYFNLYLKQTKFDKSPNSVRLRQSYYQLFTCYKLLFNEQDVSIDYLDKFNNLIVQSKETINFSFKDKIKLRFARVLWNKQKNERAKKIILSVIESSSEIKHKITAWILFSKILTEEKSYEQAIERLESVKTIPSLPLSTSLEIQYLLAWNHYLNGQFNTSAELFNQYTLNSAPKDPFWEISRYWYARSLERSDKASLAEPVYRKFLESQPGFLNFYQLVISSTLRQALPQPRTSTLMNRISFYHWPFEKSLFNESFVRGELLTDLGLKTLARNELDFALLTQDNSLKGEFYYINLLMMNGDFLNAIVRLNKLKSNVDHLPPYFYKLLYPIAYWDVLNRISTKYDLDPMLAISIMRQESAFNPNAVSSAYAIGLMQIIPPNAKIVAKRIGIKNFDISHLYDPELNILYCTNYLSYLLKKYNHLILAIGAYNAGENAMDRWLTFRWKSDPIEFIDNIPYKETRDYIKYVLRNYMSYLMIYKGIRTVPDDWFKEIEKPVRKVS